MSHHSYSPSQDPSKILLAAVVGFAAGLLFAPRSGEETRAMLKERREEAKWRMRNAKEELKRQSSEKGEQLKDAAETVRESGKQAAEAVRSGARRTKNTNEDESQNS